MIESYLLAGLFGVISLAGIIFLIFIRTPKGKTWFNGEYQTFIIHIPGQADLAPTKYALRRHPLIGIADCSPGMWRYLFH